MRLGSIKSSTQLICLLVLAVTLYACGIYEDRKYDAIYNDVQAAISKCDALGDSNIVIEGKALIFQPDVKYGKWTSSLLLKDSLKATYNDDSITVFIVETTRLDMIGYYDPNLKGWKAHRARFDICVVKWPDKTPVGKHTILSDPPPSIKVRGRGGTPGELGRIGNIKDVVKYIESLPLAKTK